MSTTAREIEANMTRKMTLVSKIFLALAGFGLLAAALSIFFIPNYAKWALGFMAGTAVFFLLWITTAFPQVKSYVGRRSTKLGMNTIVMALVVTGVIIGLNYVISQNEVEVDFTKNKLYSFSEQTAKVLKGLTNKVKVTTFLPNEARPKVGATLKRYQVLSGQKIEVRHVDLFSEPEVVRSFNAANEKNLVVFESMTRESRIQLKGSNLEEQLTNAIIRVTKDGTQNICFLTGHGELDIDSSEKRGLSLYKEKLKGYRYESKKVSLLEQEKVPTDCAALLIVGPQKALFPSEVAALVSFIEEGGKTAFFLDPYIDVSWANLVKSWGANAHDMVVADVNPVAQMMGGSPVLPIITGFDQTVPFLKKFKTPIGLRFARPVTAADVIKEGIQVKPLATTSERSFGETSDLRKTKRLEFTQGKDMQGPLSVGVHITGKSEKDKPLDIVVVGDSDFVSNEFARFVGNLDFSLNMVSYFVKDDDLISIRPKEAATKPLAVTNQDQRVTFGLTMVLFPFLFFFFAGTVYLRRRSR